MKKINSFFGVVLVTAILIAGVAVWAYVRGVGRSPGYYNHYNSRFGSGYGYNHMMGQGYGSGYGMGPGMMGSGSGTGPGMKGPGYGYGQHYGQQYGRQYQQPQRPLDRNQAKEEVENYLNSGRNPNLKLGKIEDKGNGYEINIVTKGGSLVDKLDVNKYTGWIQSAY